MIDPVPESAEDAICEWSKIIAAHVRNKMEDFHCDHLSDEQMKELNPIIRSAIFESLRQMWILRHGFLQSHKMMALNFVAHLKLQIPSYWEDPFISDERRNQEFDCIERCENNEELMPSNESSLNDLMQFCQNHLHVFDGSIEQ